MNSTCHAHRVLVVDDAEPTRERLRAWLADAGVETVACAAQREVVLELVRGLQPRVVVIDVPVRDHSGFDLLFELRSRCPGCMVIVMMNELTDEIRRRCAAGHVHHCLDKSTGFERVVDLVVEHGARP